MTRWAPLVSGPLLLAGLAAAGWFAVTGLVAALVTWPALTGVGLVAVVTAKAAIDPSRTTPSGTPGGTTSSRTNPSTTNAGGV